ncbi:MAG TPA: plastocyanin/azurin family copper-binding protein [Xanthomonadales bacterium]|nr:plastocyanin/azurin family copper-binding protein [Xanthomonadales bacterium]
MMNMRFFSPATLVLILLIFLAPNVLAQTTHTITVGDNFFSPENLTIQAGDTVRWVNAAGGMQHNVTSNSGAFAASQTSAGFTFEVTFPQAGSFGYQCTLHSGQMSGTITVQGVYTPEAEIELQSVTVLNEGSAQQNALQATGGDNSKPQAFVQGDEIEIEAVMRNNGDAGSGGFNITYYASTNTTINDADTALGTFAVSAIGAGASRTQVDLVDVPGSLSAGQYYIGAIVAFTDDSPGNNTDVDPQSITVTVAGTFLINSGLNDVWATPGKNGQGILFAVFPDAEVFFSAWFTYDSTRPPNGATSVLGQPDQRWLTMQGGFAGDTANLVVYYSTGGVFDMASPAPGNPVSIGTATIVFHDCGSATLTYPIPALGLQNTEPLVRIVADNIPLCEEINNALQP